jgi:hypothetical protein
MTSFSKTCKCHAIGSQPAAACHDASAQPCSSNKGAGNHLEIMQKKNERRRMPPALQSHGEKQMNHNHHIRSVRGRIPLILLWLLGIPLPILFIIFLFRGCS